MDKEKIKKWLDDVVEAQKRLMELRYFDDEHGLNASGIDNGFIISNGFWDIAKALDKTVTVEHKKSFEGKPVRRSRFEHNGLVFEEWEEIK